jgi:hypothetical protein
VDLFQSDVEEICIKFGRFQAVRLFESPSVIFDNPSHVNLSKLKTQLMKNNENIYYHDLSTQIWKKVKINFLILGPYIEIEDFDDSLIKYPLKTYMEFKIEGDGAAASPSNRCSEVEQYAVSKSFSARLTYSGKVQCTLITEYLCRSATIVKGGRIYAPYAVLCQSSGFGKTRGACESGRRLASIYGVFRKHTDTGFPKQADWLGLLYYFIYDAIEVDIPRTGYLEIVDTKVGRALIFFNCLMSAFEFWFKTLIGEAFYKELFEDKKIPTNVDEDKIEKLCKAYDFITDSYKNGNAGVEIFQNQLQIELSKSKNSTDLTVETICRQINLKANNFVPLNEIVFKRRNQLDKELWSDFIRTHLSPSSDAPASSSADKATGESENSYRIWPNENQTSFPFLIILDEASVLNELTRPGQVSTLTIIRRALHFIPPSSSFLVVTLGTNCDISILDKPITDNSLRFVERSDLLYPLIVTGNWDIHAEESRVDQLVVDGALLRNHRTLLLSCSFGRPLWSSLALEYIIIAAVTKIRNGCADLFTPMIASWCIRVGLTVHADSKLSEKLLRSHMAILVAASSDSERLIVNYSAEPILTIAAREFIKDHKNEYFKSLLQFVEGVPTDRGKIGESVFCEILLSAMDKSIRIDTFSNRNPAGANEYLIKIFNTRNFLLECDDDSKQVIDIDAIEYWCKVNYHITNVNNFLKSLYSDSVFEMIRPFLPSSLLQGLLNFDQFITTHRDFPYEQFFEKEQEEFVELTDASGAYAKKCDIFDKAILKAGLLKRVAYGCPAGYYGFDAIVPVLIEVDVEVEVRTQINDGKTIETVLGLQNSTQLSQKRSGSAVETECIAYEIKKKHVYSFIGIQFKVGQADKIETLTKSDPFIHLNIEDYEDWEVQAIRENFLVLVLSSENDIEKSKLTDVRVNSVKEPFSVTAYNTKDDLSDAGSFLPTLNAAFYKLPKSFYTLKLTNVIKAPKFPHEIPSPSTYSQVKIAPHVNICGISWSNEKKHMCLWTSSLLAFEGLLGHEILNLSHQIIRNDRSIFKNQIDSFGLKTVADALLNTHFAYYPNSDPLLRKLRGQKKIKPVLTNFNHWRTDLAVYNDPKLKL